MAPPGQQAPQHGRHRRQHGAALSEELRHALRRELRNQHQAGAAAHRQQAHPEAEDEGEAQRHDDAVLSAEAQEPVEHGKLAGHPLVADDDALRLARAARGEDDEGGAAQVVARRRRSGRDAFDAPAIDAQACAGCLPDRVGGERRRSGGDRHRHAAREPDAEQRGKVRRRVGEGRQHRLARRDARQIARDRPGLGEQLLAPKRPLPRRPRSAPRIGRALPPDSAPGRRSRRGLGKARIAPGERRLEPVAPGDVHELRPCRASPRPRWRDRSRAPPPAPRAALAPRARG